MRKPKKFKLNKEVIVELSQDQSMELKGGRVTYPTIGTVASFTLNSYCSKGPDCYILQSKKCIM